MKIKLFASLVEVLNSDYCPFLVENEMRDYFSVISLHIIVRIKTSSDVKLKEASRIKMSRKSGLSIPFSHG